MNHSNVYKCQAVKHTSLYCLYFLMRGNSSVSSHYMRQGSGKDRARALKINFERRHKVEKKKKKKSTKFQAFKHTFTQIGFFFFFLHLLQIVFHFNR